MILRLPPTPTASRHARSGFSLVEVTLAIGLLAFCLIPLMGLIPTGLNAQRNAAERNMAADALSMAATALRSSQFNGRSTSGKAIYRLPQYFCDADSPALTPTIYTVDDKPFTRTYAILEDGSIRKTSDADKKIARQTMFVTFYPPSTGEKIVNTASGSAVAPTTAAGIYAVVAWPALASDKPETTVDQLKNRQGFMEGYITYVPRN